jgi:DNA polymerase/3'-5' exonuclease PolX
VSDEPKRYPLCTALAVAEGLVRQLQPYCTRIEIAGSIRRRKCLVSDIEILYISRTCARPTPGELFGTVEIGQADEVLARWLREGTLHQRLNTLGNPTWGPLNKLAVHAATGIPVDLFSTHEESWFNYLVCRTGPADLNRRIAQGALARGLHWRPYEKGFRRYGPDGEHWELADSERRVFELAGLPYREPEDRND